MSVDVETAGPSPSRYAMLSIGACLVDDRSRTFYAELVPDRGRVDEQALAVSGLSMDTLRDDGRPPDDAMREFARWVEASVPEGRRPVMVALNAPFDWMFVADYLHRYVGRNPFGHSALDLKALYMGRTGEPWHRTGFADMAARVGTEPTLSHNALQDALDQAEVFRRVLALDPDAVVR